MTRRYRNKVCLWLCVVAAAQVFWSAQLEGGENFECSGCLNILDVRWDRRFYDGTAGWAGLVKWFHNSAGLPGSLTASNFQNAVQAGFDTWNAVDGGFGGSPLVPIVTFQGATAASVGAVDGVNTIGWYTGSPGGTLASTPCTFLAGPGTTTSMGGNTVLPIGGGMTIPFPGPAGITYPAGTLIDCDMRFDNADAWSTGAPMPGLIDVQSIATHEERHFIGLAHSTVGETTGTFADDATMIPFAPSNNIDFRSPADDDISSVVRTYSRVNGLPQTTGGRGRLLGTLKKSAGCTSMATGVSVRAYLASQGLEGANAVETFSGSQLRQGLAGEPFNGSIELNVAPGGPYTIYARTFESGGSGFYLAGRYNGTATNSNTLDSSGGSQAFDNLATVASIAAGQTIDLGTVGILGCVANQPPSAVSVTPSSGGGSTQTFSFLYSDPNGFGDLSGMQMIVNATLGGASACYTHYDRASNAVFLLNDGATGWLGPVTLGTANTVQNSQCIVNALTSSASGVGNNLTVNLALTFKPAFAGAKNVYAQLQDNGGLLAGWQQLGTWTAP